jgi:ParB/RepB/Spo0J family partition protein
MSEPTQPNLLPDEMPEGEYRELPLTVLALGNGQGPDTSLVQSIQRFGLLQPIIAMTRGETWVVIDGRRRCLAAISIGWETIPAYVLPAGSVNPHVVQLASHVLRSRNRAAEIDAIEALMKDGSDEDTIVAATGLMKGEIRALLPLTNLPPMLRTALREGKMAASTAQEAAKLSPQAQRRLEDVFTEKGRVSAPDVKEQRQARTQAAAMALDLGSLAGTVPDYEPPPPSPVPGACLLVDTDPSDAFARELQENPAAQALARDLEAITSHVVPLDDPTASYVPWSVVLGLVTDLEKASKWADVRDARRKLCEQLRGWQERGVVIR